MKNNLLDLEYEELLSTLKAYDSSTFRGKQIYQWLMKGASFDEMSNVSKTLRASLANDFLTGHASIKEKQVSMIDGTTKYLFKLADGILVESVVMNYSYGSTICISTQAGCNMGCTFCSSAIDGKARDLTAGDMLAQVIGAIKDIGGERPIKNIVLMGAGEPFDNYDNTIKFLRRVNSPNGLHIGWRNISLSTCGFVDKIMDFANENIPITLCISLHAGNDMTRKKIMPIANGYSIKETIDAAQYYFERTGRRLIIEYAMMDGVNDDENNANDLVKHIRHLTCNVNIIALNAGRENIKASSRKTIENFINILKEKKVNVTTRRTMGADIEGACGQLRHRIVNEK